MTEKEALKLALEALKYPLNQSHENFNVDMAELLAHRAITAIKEALPQQEQDWSTLEAMQGSLREHMARIKELESQLAQPEQEPVAWAMYKKGRLESFWMDKGDAFDFEFTSEHSWSPLYTNPPQRKPLTDEEIINEADCFDWGKDCAVRFARAIEAAHGIKGEA